MARPVFRRGYVRPARPRWVGTFASSPGSILLGTVPSGAVAHGLNLAAGAATLALGTVTSGAVVRGINLVSAPLQLGTVSSTAVAHGLNLSAGAATLQLSTIGSTATAHGITLAQPGSYKNLVVVGRGIMDSQRSIVRDANNRVWIFAAEDRPFQGDTSEELTNFLRAYKADQTGIPSSFTEVDTAHRPKSAAATSTFDVPTVALDSTGVVHMIYQDYTARNLYYTTFNTNTGLWSGTVTTLVAGGMNIQDGAWRRSLYAAALAIDASDNLHVVYSAGTTVSYITKPSGGSWSGATTIATGQTNPVHHQLVCDASGNLFTVWVHNPNGATSDIHFQQKVGGSWLAAAETVVTGVQTDSNLDQTPQVALMSNGEPNALYITNSAEVMTLKRRSGGVWGAADSTGVDTHAPGLYVVGDDIYALEGHSIGTTPDIQSAYTYKLAGGAWSAEQILVQSSNTKDGSASARYEPHHKDPWPQYIDVAYMDEDDDDTTTTNHFAVVYYAAIQPQHIWLGSVASTAQARGLNLSAGVATLALGTTTNTAVVHGINFTTTTIPLGTISSGAVARGLNLSAGAATLALGKASTTNVVGGLNFTAGAASLAVGSVSSTAAAHGINLLSGSTGTSTARKRVVHIRFSVYH